MICIENLKTYYRSLIGTQKSMFPRALVHALDDLNLTEIDILRLALSYQHRKIIFPGLHAFYNTPTVRMFHKLDKLGLFETQDACNQFLTIAENPDALKALDYLYRAQLLAKPIFLQNFSKLMTLTHSADNLRFVLKTLYHRNLLTQDNFNALLKHPFKYTMTGEAPPVVPTYGTIYLRAEANQLYYTLLTPQDEYIEDTIDTTELLSKVHFDRDKDVLRSFLHGAREFAQLPEDLIEILQASVLTKTSERKQSTSQFTSLKNALDRLCDMDYRRIRWRRMGRESGYSIAGFRNYQRLHQDLLSSQNQVFAQQNFDLLDQCTISSIQQQEWDDGVLKGIAEDMRILHYYNLLTPEIREALLQRSAPAKLNYTLAQFNQENILHTPDIQYYLQAILRSKKPSEVTFSIILLHKKVIPPILQPMILNAIADSDAPAQLGIAISVLVDQNLLSEENFQQLIRVQCRIDKNKSDDLWNRVSRRNLTQERWNTIVLLADTSDQNLASIRQEYDIPREIAHRHITQTVKARRFEAGLFGQSSRQEKMSKPPDSVMEMIEDYLQQCALLDEQQVRPESEKANIFYEIIAPNGNKSYLFGTYHSGDIRVISLPSEIKQAFDEATVFITESDFTEIKHAEFNQNYQALLKEHKEYLSSLASQEFKQDLQKALKIHYPNRETLSQKEQLEVLQAQTSMLPMHVALLLMQDPHEKDKSDSDFLDFRLLCSALDNQKKVIYLEEANTGIAKGMNLTYAEHLEYYHFVTQHLAVCRAQQLTRQAMIEAYLSGNIEIFDKDIAKLDDAPEAVKKVRRELIEERDKIMANNMQPHLNTEQAFVAVGAAHLTGIIEQLHDKGYEVRNVPLSKKQYGITERMVTSDHPKLF